MIVAYPTRLAASKNISGSFQKVGINKKSSGLVLAIFDANNQQVEDVCDRVHGTRVESIPFDPTNFDILRKV